MSLFLLLSLLSLLSLATSLGSPPCDRIIAGLEGQDAVAWVRRCTSLEQGVVNFLVQEGVSGQELWEMSPWELEDMMSLAPPATERLYQELHGGADGIPSTRSFFLEDIGEVALRILEPQQGKVYVKSEEDNDRGGIVSEEGKLIVVFELVCASKVPFSMRFNAQWQANEHFHELSVSSSCSSNEHQKYNYLAMPNAWSLLRKGQNTFGLWLELEGSEKFMEEVVDFYVFSCPQQRRGCKEHAFLKGTVGGRIGGGGGGGGRGGRGGGESASVVVNEAGEEEGETVSGSMGSRLAGVWDGRVCELISSFSGGAIEFQLTVIERYQFGCSYQVRFLLPDSSGNHQDRWRSPGRVDVQDRHHIEDNGRRSRLLRLSFRLPACLQQDRILVQLVSSSCSPPIEWWGARVWDLGGPQQELSWPWRHGWAGEAITPGRTVAKFRVEMDKFGDGAKRRGSCGSQQFLVSACNRTDSSSSSSSSSSSPLPSHLVSAQSSSSCSCPSPSTTSPPTPSPSSSRWGIGIKKSHERFLISKVVEGSPADLSGLVHQGDILISINHVEVGGKGLQEVIAVFQSCPVRLVEGPAEAQQQILMLSLRSPRDGSVRHVELAM